MPGDTEYILLENFLSGPNFHEKGTLNNWFIRQKKEIHKEKDIIDEGKMLNERRNRLMRENFVEIQTIQQLNLYLKYLG